MIGRLTILGKIKAWQAVFAAFVTLTSAYSGASAIGLDLPRFVWISELRAAEQKTDSLVLRTERLHETSLLRAHADVLSRIAELEAKHIPVPANLLAMEEMLRDDLQRQKQYVRELENKTRTQGK